MLVCQHLFNCQRKNKKIIYADVYRNTIDDGDSQTSPLPIFSGGGGTSVHRLLLSLVSINYDDDVIRVTCRFHWLSPLTGISSGNIMRALV